MASLNQVQLIGFVGDEPKIIPTRSGKTMTSLTLATTDREIKRQDGSVIPERTEWHNITIFGHSAEFVKNYVHKGAQLFVQGSIHSRTFDKQDGTKGYITEITADIVQLLDRKQQPAQQPTATSPDMATAYANPGVASTGNDGLPF
ncbi:MAG: single-stranded DNA-binding protein [Roseburia sp.]|nr:single-stranded DNA-binding protein [Roseburia sp.]